MTYTDNKQLKDQRTHKRIALNLNASFSINDTIKESCVIRDFCKGGLFLTFSDNSTQLRNTINRWDSIGKPLLIEFQHDNELFKIHTVLVRTLDSAFAVKFDKESSAPISVFQQLSQRHHEKTNRVITSTHDKELLLQCESLACEHLRPLLQKVFDSIHEGLILLTNVASSDREESQLLDVRAQIERNRSILIDNYMRAFIRGIRGLIDEDLIGSSALFRPLSKDQLSIVDKNDFEDWLLIKVIISRSEVAYRDNLLMLQMRIDILAEDKSNAVAKKSVRVDNPLAPAAICYPFGDIIHQLKLGNQVEKLIYKAFEVELINNLEDFYEEANAALKAGGILPNLVPSVQNPLKRNDIRKTAVARKQNTSSQTSAHHHNTQAANSPSYSNSPNDRNSSSSSDKTGLDNQDHGASITPTTGRVHNKSALLVRATQNLIHVRRANINYCLQESIQGPPPTHNLSVQRNTPDIAAKLDQTPNLTLPADGQHHTKTHLSQVLSGFQLDPSQYYHQLNEIECQFNTTQSERNQQKNSSGVLRQLLLPPDSNFNNQEITDNENESMEITDGFVEAILSNSSIATDLKPFLSKLRLPIFKLFLQDTSLFDLENHPARKLIDGIANIPLDQGKVPADYQKLLNSGIDRVVTHFNGNLETFVELVESLDNRFDYLDKRYQRNLSRVIEICEGKEKLDHANKLVASEIDKHYKVRAKIPKIMDQLLELGWMHLMQLCILRNGADSDQWKAAASILEALTKYFHGSYATDNDTNTTINQLLSSVRAGLESVHRLESCENTVFQLSEQLFSEGRHSVEWINYSEKNKVSPSDSDIAEIGITSFSQSENSQTLESFEARHSAKKTLLRWIKRVKSIKLGDRVEFTYDLTDNKSITDKKHVEHVAWIAQDKDYFVFVSAQGLRSHELDLTTFAILLRDKRAALLEGNETGIVAQGLETMAHGIHEKLLYESTHDQLTGLLNRQGFERQVEQAIQSAKATHCFHLLCHIDLSQFKVINSRAGLAAGEQLLQNISSLIKTKTPSATIIARQSGNEFGLLLLQHSEEQGYRIIDDLLQAIRAYRFVWETDLYHVGASIGILEINQNSDDSEQLLKKVLSCCTNAGESGGDRIISYETNDLQTKRDPTVAWISAVNVALEENKLRLRMQRIQPIEASIQHQPPNCEILLSALDENNNAIPPAEFVHIAERHNRMKMIDQWVIKNTFNWMVNNPEWSKYFGRVSINLSGDSINDEQLLNFIFEEFNSKNIPRERICFEITETLAINHLENAADFMSEMKSIGCSFSLDDFGSGMSSYTYLKKLPVEYLKIDGSFVKNIANDPMDLAIVKSMNDIAHLMGKKTVAEFVSSKAVLDKLIEIGVDYAQGYHIEKPRWLDEWRS